MSRRSVFIAAVLLGLDIDRPTPKPVDAPRGETFHGHLDRCAQCERNPFALCPIGQALLKREAGSA